MFLTQPEPHQKTGAKQIHEWNGRALVADEQGCGKTLLVLYYLFKKHKARPAIIVCPASVKYNWQSEARMHAGMMSEIVEGETVPKIRQGFHVKIPHPLLIINYEILGPWLDYLKALNPIAVVIDEIQNVTNPSSQRYRHLRELCGYDSVKYVIGMSGTPLTNRNAELWAPLSLIQPALFPSYHKFCWRFTKPFMMRNKWIFAGARNTRSLHRILKKRVMIRRKKVDVLKNLPPKHRVITTVKIKDRSEYDEANTNFLKWVAKKSVNRYKKAKKNENLVKLGYLIRLAGKLKVNEVVKWIDKWTAENTGKKLVVLSGHTKMLNVLERRFGKEVSVRIDGSVNGKKRHQAVQSFQKKKKVLYLFGHHKAAGVGLTLHAAADLLYTDFPWTPGTLGQGEDRIHRFGQTKKCTIYYLVAEDTIEERLVKVLHEKQDILDAVLDGKSNDNQLEVFNALLQELKTNRRSNKTK